MKKNIVIIFLLLFFSFLAFAEEEAYIEALTDKATISVDKEEFFAEGGLRVKYEDIQVTANRIKKVPDKNIIIAYDNVIFKQKDTIVEAEEVEVNLDEKSAKITKGKSSAKFGEGKIYYVGKEIKAKYPYKAIAKKSSFSTCEHDEPHYHLKAGKIEIYPDIPDSNSKEDADNNRDGSDDKIIAYNSILYIGKIPVFWFPYYISSMSDQKAALFPRFGDDSETGKYVIWGTQYRLNRQFLKGYINLQWGEKKGWYIDGKNSYYFTPENKGDVTLVKYLIPKGNVPKEWDWKWHHDAVFKLKDTVGTTLSAIVKDGTWNIDYQNQTLNQLKTSSGSAIDKVIKKEDVAGTKTFQKAELKINQNWLSDINTYVYIKYVNDKSLLKKIVDINNNVTTPAGVSNDISDNELQNEYRYTQNNNNFKLILHSNDFTDLDPGNRGDDKSKSKVRDGEIELKKIKVDFIYINKNEDKWGKTSFDTLETYKKWWQTYDYQIEESYTLRVGDYAIFNTGFNTGATFEQVDTKSKKRDYTKYDYINTQELFETNSGAIKYDIEEKSETYKAATYRINNSAIDLYLLGKLNSAYEHQWKVHKTGERENKQKYSETITTLLFDNYWDDEREYDLKLENIVQGTHESSYGKKPDEQKLDDRRRSISEGIKLYFGNSETKLNTKYSDVFYNITNIKKNEEINHELLYSIDKDSGKLSFKETSEFSKEKFRLKRDTFYEYTTTIDSKQYNLSYSITRNYDLILGPDLVKGQKKTWKGTIPVNKFKLSYSREDNLGRTTSTGAINAQSMVENFIVNFNNGHQVYNTTLDFTFQKNKDILLDKRKDSTLSLSFKYLDKSWNLKETKKTEAAKTEEKKLKLTVEEIIEADRLLREEEAKKRNISFGDFMSLGNEKASAPLDKSKEYSFGISYTVDEEFLKREKFTYQNYEKSWKGVGISNTFKYSDRFMLTLRNNYNRSKGGASLSSKTSSQELQFTLGPKDYFWLIKIARDYDDKEKYEKLMRYTVEHNIHCTNLSMFYETKKSKKNVTNQEYSVGLTLKLTAFPAKSYTRKVGQTEDGKTFNSSDVGL